MTVPLATLPLVVFDAQEEKSQTPSDIPLRKKMHPAVAHFRQLHETPPSPQLKEWLASFDMPRQVDATIFAEGVRKFIQLANASPLADPSKLHRKSLYGSIYAGLHYQHDLVVLWNTAHREAEPLKAFMLAPPSVWELTCQNNCPTFIYKGVKPAQALDQFVQGPSTIDCGMFAQLSIWFGIRYMLGNERFNQCFGRTPFFLTQFVFSAITDSSKPYLGNPLYAFLSAEKESATAPAVCLKYLANSDLYRFKHPGETSIGQNCIIIENQYAVFDPCVQDPQNTEAAILDQLRRRFNEERSCHVAECLAAYAATPEKYHAVLGKTYGELITIADALRDKTFSEEEFLAVTQNPSFELAFHLPAFSAWLQRVENHRIEIRPLPPLDYPPVSIPHALLEVIPFENKMSMDFSRFQQKTPQQKELMEISTQFCASVMAGESKLVILTGKAGIGKTASAVCAAKELSTRGKHVFWISEVLLNNWAEQAKNMADLEKCGADIDALLATHPDAVFLDDDNLVGFAGKLLLEKIYSWWAQHPGKGLFITSNQPLHFETCYGYRLNQKYHYPPFVCYSSLQYLNWQCKTDLAGESMRTKREGQSIGAIVSEACWHEKKNLLKAFECIPAFDMDKEVSPIRKEIRQIGCMTACQTYQQLSALQRSWLYEFEVENSMAYKNGEPCWVEGYPTVCIRKFEKTSCETIVLELRENMYRFRGTSIIEATCMDQLICVLNYVHDQGGRRVILVNQTSYSTEQLMTYIKKQLPEAERERTWSRLMLLLCGETEDSIFDHTQWDGHSESIMSKSSSFASAEGCNPYAIMQPFTTMENSPKTQDILLDEVEQSAEEGYAALFKGVDIEKCVETLGEEVAKFSNGAQQSRYTPRLVGGLVGPDACDEKQAPCFTPTFTFRLEPNR